MSKKKPGSGEKKNKKYLSDEDLAGMAKELTLHIESESDRGVILILSAYLEELLGLVIRNSCVSDHEGEALMEYHGPAGTFSSKISLCSAFALIHKTEARALETVRKIRNSAAHFDHKKRGFNVLFDSDQTVAHVENLVSIMNFELKSQDPESIRINFILAARLLALKLLVRNYEAIRPMPPRTVKEIANESRIKLGNTPLGQFTHYAVDELKKGNFGPSEVLNDAIQKTLKEFLNENHKEILSNETDSSEK